MSNRFKFLLVIVTGMIICSCTQSKYLVKSSSELTSLDFRTNVLNYIPVSDQDMRSSVVLDSTCSLIAARKLSKAGRYLDNIKTGKSDYYLARTLYDISGDNYKGAAVSLRGIKDGDYPVLKQLLGIDLKYELARQNGRTFFNDILDDYQKLVDKYPDNKLLKDIVLVRIRYIRYGY